MFANNKFYVKRGKNSFKSGVWNFDHTVSDFEGEFSVNKCSVFYRTRKRYFDIFNIFLI